MEDTVLDLLGDIELNRDLKRCQVLENLLDDLYENLDYSTSLSELERKYHCQISVSKEKHHQLQYTFYVTITSDLVDGELGLEFDDGIDTGTSLRSYSLEGKVEPEPKYVEVIKDLVLNKEAYINTAFSVYKAELVFPRYKPEILKLLNNRNYDNYVTGGGTNKTDKYYDDKFQQFRNMGLFWDVVYETIEVDRNFV